jgi:hypothetical protein
VSLYVRKFNYGDIVHYRWGGDNLIHSASMFIADTSDHRLLLLPISDTNYNLTLNSPIVSKDRGSWEDCDQRCIHNPSNVTNLWKENK